MDEGAGHGGWRLESLECRRLLSIAPVPFEHITIDANPGNAPLEKTLADIDGDGKLDAVVGFDIGAGSGGIVWYRFPHSGNPADPWDRFTIAAPGGQAYEDVVPYDVNGDGATDLIASYNSSVVWFENPAGEQHGDPTTSGPWTEHFIGPDFAHEITLGDFDGDGKIDVATQQHIYFQNSPDDWTTVGAPQYDRTQRGVTRFDSGSGLGAVDLAGVGNGPEYPIVWFENPRDHGGDARTDVWTPHTIGASYRPGDADVGVSLAAADVNGDGRVDVITAHGEGGAGPARGGLVWWEAPADRANGAWIKHTIDPTVDDVHKISLADINNDGRTDIVFSEQDQSARKRVGVYYNLDGSGNHWQLQVLTTHGGHNQAVGDVNGDGTIDILSAPHGVYTGFNPIELFVNQIGSGNAAGPVASASAAAGADPVITTAAVGTSAYVGPGYAIKTLGPDLSGGTLVQTDNKAAAKSFRGDTYLTLHLSAPATLYVCYDRRKKALPAWLNDGTWALANSSASVTVAGNGAMLVYSKKFDAGDVTLGGNLQSPAKGARSNYFVIAQPA